MLATGGGAWDRLAGGAGDDSYIVEIAQTTVAEPFGGGTIYSYASYLMVSSEVETIMLLDGGEGTDTAVFAGAAADYLLSLNGDGSSQVENTAGFEGIDTLKDIELLGFSDQTLSVTDILWS